MTLLAVVRAEEAISPVEGVTAYSVQGTPADSVILALESLYPEPFDLVVSGINSGANLGTDVLVSGTVGAALQGYIRNIPSIAVSITSLTDIQHDAAATTIKALAKALASNTLPKPLLLNVNLPNVTPDKIKRAELTALGPGAYLQTVERVNDGRRVHYWIKHNKPTNPPLEEGSDIWAVRNNHISITPLNRLFSDSQSEKQHFGVLTEGVSEALSL
jgi:5'-nucleotidase